MTGMAASRRAVPLAHDRVGGGEPLLLLHGLGSDRHAWEAVVPRLAARREVFAIDLPGSGESSPLGTATPHTIAAQADAVEAFITELGLETPHVGGQPRL
jgi:pimeloyl-ACP methyl ester carboxylesterase